jgi:Co/Zn/Cd efflux system component
VDDCCAGKAEALVVLRERQASTLRTVLVANGAMFGVELAAGIMVGSVALLADSLDMLGDALVYGLSLYGVARGTVWKARAAAFKALLMALFGLFVLGQVIWKTLYPELPGAVGMGVIGALALAVNAGCFALLWRHRADDINMRSVWLCSRNDLIANASVLVAAAAVWIIASPWPDLLVGAFSCVLFLRSAVTVAREARAELVAAKRASLPAESQSAETQPLWHDAAGGGA